MKYIVTLFWAFLISNVTFYLGSALTSTAYNFIHATLFSVIITFAVALIVKLLPPIAKDSH